MSVCVCVGTKDKEESRYKTGRTKEKMERRARPAKSGLWQFV